MITDSDCRLILDNMPGRYVIFTPDAPHFTIIYCNNVLLQTTASASSVIGQGLFDVFIREDNNTEAAGNTSLSTALMAVIANKQTYRMAPQRFDLLDAQAGHYKAMYCSPLIVPVLDKNEQLSYIILLLAEDAAGNQLPQSKKTQQEFTYLHEVQFEILDSIEDAFISTDRNFTVQYWNKQAENIFKINRQDALGKNLWNVVTTDGADMLHNSFVKALETNKPAHFEAYYASLDLWLQVSGYPFIDGLSAVLVNVTDKKKIEEEVRKNEQRFRALIENISDGWIVISPAGAILEFSASAQKLLGYEFKYFKGQHYKNLFFQADVSGVEKAFQSTLQPAGSQHLYDEQRIPATGNSHYNAENVNAVQFRFIKLGGGIRWMEGSFHNLLHEETIEAIVFTFRDITARREQELQLQASEEKYRYLFQNSPAAIIIWTLDDLWIREVNETAGLQYGYTRNEFLSMTFFDLNAAEPHDGTDNLVSELRRENAVGQGIWQHKTKKGERIYMNISFHKIKYGDMDAVLTLATNITEIVLLQQKLEQERQIKQKEITEAVLKAQENERAELGRELHDNISQVLTTARMYIEHSFSRHEKQEALLKHSLEYISKAVGEIRQLSHMLMPPSLNDISLKQSLNELFINLKNLSDFRFSFKFLLPDEKRISADLKLTVFRIVQEGLNNVLRHAKATEIEVRIEQKDTTLEVCIEDNGIGFDAQEKNHGLGLRNISSRSNLFGGAVELSSQPGKGTKLQVVFPLSGMQAG